MDNTKNYRLNLPEDSDVVDVNILNENFEVLDKILYNLEENMNNNKAIEEIANNVATSTEVVEKLQKTVNQFSATLNEIKKETNILKQRYLIRTTVDFYEAEIPITEGVEFSEENADELFTTMLEVEGEGFLEFLHARLNNSSTYTGAIRVTIDGQVVAFKYNDTSINASYTIGSKRYMIDSKIYFPYGSDSMVPSYTHGMLIRSEYEKISEPGYFDYVDDKVYFSKNLKIECFANGMSVSTTPYLKAAYYLI